MATTQTPHIVVHWLDKSRAQRILWLLEELDLPYDVELYHREPLEAPASLRKIHPLGKSPVITIAAPPSPSPSPSPSEPKVLAESGFIASYLCTHFAGRPSHPASSTLVPRKWRAGLEGQPAGETDAWLRHEYLLHYSEGSFFPLIIVKLILGLLSTDRVPFFIRPISSFLAAKIAEGYIFPNAKRHLAFLEDMLENPPPGGEKEGEKEGEGKGGYLCGSSLTAADILMSFPLLIAKSRFADAGKWEGGSIETAFPKLWRYLERLEVEKGYRQSIEKVKELDGGNYSTSID
ncbi:related to glutathione S-transferase [Cephalotrichum gorgonifer]|uniref:Related to glutathione S-transferase n=1 Tax=Cephalotrichum gorgonifer TaxID=2041049 RepID=A0AAE8N181_9PEZI|nr:related to glutathione S-transferase [Cephalotrichum gorgonifer]